LALINGRLIDGTVAAPVKNTVLAIGTEGKILAATHNATHVCGLAHFQKTS
jgi:hypothetical protein